MQIDGAELLFQGLPLIAAISRQIPTTRNAPRQRIAPPSPAPIAQFGGFVADLGEKGGSAPWAVNPVARKRQI